MLIDAGVALSLLYVPIEGNGSAVLGLLRLKSVSGISLPSRSESHRRMPLCLGAMDSQISCTPHDDT